MVLEQSLAGDVLIKPRASDQKPPQGSLPAEVRAVLRTTTAVETDLVLGQKIWISAVNAVTAVPRVGGRGKIAEVVREGNLAVNIAAEVSDGGIAEIDGINTLRKQREGAKKI